MTTDAEQGEAGGEAEQAAPPNADSPNADAGAAPQSGGAESAEAADTGGVTWADEHLADGDGSSPGGDGTSVAEQAEADGAPDLSQISVEDLVVDLERVSTERDQYLDSSRRIQAEFENYKKAVAKREVEARERANESLINEILPVLDACDGAVANGATDVEPVRAALVGALTKQGLGRIDDQDVVFDPACHDAVMHEPAEGEEEGPLVAEVMRAGYSWKGRVVRPAMVRVRG